MKIIAWLLLVWFSAESHGANSDPVISFIGAEVRSGGTASWRGLEALAAAGFTAVGPYRWHYTHHGFPDPEALVKTALGDHGMNTILADELVIKKSVEQGLFDTGIRPMPVSDPDFIRERVGAMTALQTGNRVRAYFLCDEPSALNFTNLAAWHTEFLRRDPDTPIYCNLYPAYAIPRALGTANYEEYVARFVAEVRPDILSFDYYPFRTDRKLTQKLIRDYFENAEIVSRHARDNGLPFWQILQVRAVGNSIRAVSEAELHWQAFSALAYGARGILYFVVTGEPHNGGILSSEGVPHAPVYATVLGLNQELQNLWEALAGGRWVGAIRCEAQQKCPIPGLGGGWSISVQEAPVTAGVYDRGEDTFLLLTTASPHGGAAWVTPPGGEAQRIRPGQARLVKINASLKERVVQ